MLYVIKVGAFEGGALEGGVLEGGVLDGDILRVGGLRTSEQPKPKGAEVLFYLYSWLGSFGIHRACVWRCHPGEAQPGLRDPSHCK